MADKPTLKYTTTGTPVSFTQPANVGINFKWYVESVCTNASKKTWEIRYFLLVQSSKDISYASAEWSLPFGNDKYVGAYLRNSDGTKGTQAIPGDDKLHILYLEGDRARNGYIVDTQTAKGTSDVEELPSRQFLLYTSKDSETEKIWSYTGNIKFGGISTTSPSITEFSVLSRTKTSIKIGYRFSAPYLSTVRMKLNGTDVSVTQDVDVGYHEYTFTNLTEYTDYSVAVFVECQNGKTTSESTTTKTLPTYATSITCADNVYVDEGDTANLSVTVSPNNASEKKVRFRNQSNTGYSFNGNSSYKGTEATIRGNNEEGQSVPYELTVDTIDGSFLSKTVNVYVCRPAKSIAPNVSTKKMTIGQTYAISYTIYPIGSTDKTVTFTSSDTDVATVSGGVVTAVSAGTAIITLSLARRVGDPVTSSVLVEVVSTETTNDDIAFAPDFMTAEFVDSVFQNLNFYRSRLMSFNEITGNDYAWARNLDIPVFNPPDTNGFLTNPYDTRNVLNQIESCMSDLFDAIMTINEGDGYEDCRTAYAAFGHEEQHGGFEEFVFSRFYWGEMETIDDETLINDAVVLEPQSVVERWVSFGGGRYTAKIAEFLYINGAM